MELIAAATADQYVAAMRIAHDDPEVDPIISMFLPPLATESDEVARARQHGAEEPVLVVFMSAEDLLDVRTTSGGWLPGFHTPEPAAIALARARSAPGIPRPAGV